MTLNFEHASRRPGVFRRLTSLSVDEFQTLVTKLEPEWRRRERTRLEARPRTNAVGQGRPYAGNFASLLLVVLTYLRTSSGNALLSLLFDLDEVTIRTYRRRITPLLQDRFLPATPVQGKVKRINDLDEFLRLYPELKELIGDGTELKIQRPKRRQRVSYTGKSKRHVKKTVVEINPNDGLFLGRTKLRPGRVHDKRVLAEDPLYRRIRSPDLTKRADSAWTGEDPKQGWLVNARGTRGHSLTKRQKKANRQLSKIRIKVEHAIRRLKVYRRLAETVVIRGKNDLEAAVNAAMNLANFTVLARQTVEAA
ncbi:transposase [Candidatus Berkelbacteria bacterium]|nr:transposase [Candidatus Berkelbacteria bacterium]